MSNFKKKHGSTFEKLEPAIPPALVTSHTVIHPPRGPYWDPNGPDIELYKDRQKKKIKDGDISDITKINPIFGKGGKIQIPIDPGYEPTWRPGRDGDGGPGGPGPGEPGDEPGDKEYFEIDKDEFLKLYFGDLSLPHLRQKEKASSTVISEKRRGTQRTGPRARLDKPATAKARIKRAIAQRNAHPENFEDPTQVPDASVVPFAKSDMRYFKLDEKPVPDSKAVVYYILDASGSTDGEPLLIFKNAFFVFTLFLMAKYDKVEIVMISHTTDAEICKTEDEFFNIKSSGGTSFSPAYKLTWEDAQKRYPGSEWNRYLFQCTDGDVWGNDADEIGKWWTTFLSPAGDFNYGFYLEAKGWSSSSDWATGGKALLKLPKDIRQYVGMARIAKATELQQAFKKMFSPS